MDKLYFGTLLAILIFSTFILETPAARQCCLQYRKAPVRCALLKGYTIQDNTRHCDLQAIIFQTVHNKFVCADPLQRWTQHRVSCLLEKASKLNKDSPSRK